MESTKNKMQTILDRSECLYHFSDIQNAIEKMGVEITEKLKDANPLVLCVMIGALIPAGHLLTRLQFPLEVDYIHATRYRGATRGGDLHWLVEPRQSLKDRTILVIDDIMDGGLTLGAIIDYCQLGNAKKVYTAVMVNKIRQREPGVNFEPDFVGLHTEDRYVYGFGLDYEEHMRNLPGIYALKE